MVSSVKWDNITSLVGVMWSRENVWKLLCLCFLPRDCEQFLGPWARDTSSLALEERASGWDSQGGTHGEGDTGVALLEGQDSK